MSFPDESSHSEITLLQEPSPEEIANAAAVELVKRDADTATAWIEGQQWNEQWRVIDILYDSPRNFATFEGSQTQKAAVNRFILAQHVNSIHPKYMEGLFYDDQLFTTKAAPGTDEDVAKARASVIRTQLKEMNFEQEVNSGTFQILLHGTGIWKWGLEQVEEKYYEYQRADYPLQTQGLDGQTKEVPTTESSTYTEVEKKRVVIKAFFENKEIRGILVDPKLKWPDIRRAGYVIDKYYLTLAQLLALKVDESYDLPSEETLKQWIAEPKEPAAALGTQDSSQGSPSVAGQGVPDWEDTSDDPYLDCLMVLERWDNEKVITTLQNKTCIRNQENKYGCLPFYSANYYNRIRSFWGIGLGKIVGTDQRLQQGLENGGIALLQLLLDPPFVHNTEQFVLTQNVRLRKGGAIKVKGDVRTAIAPMEMPKLPLGELFAFLQRSQSNAEAADGVNELFTAGAMPGPGTGGRSSATRNATGVNAISGANASRLEGPLGLFCRQVFVPWVYQLDLLNRRFLMTTPEGHDQIKQILGKEMPDYKFDGLPFLDGKVEFDVLAGTHLAAKRIVAQAMPIMFSIFEQPQIQDQLAKYFGKTINLMELFSMFFESIGWPTNKRSLFMDAPAEVIQGLRQQEQQGKLQNELTMQQLRGQQASQLQAEKTQGGMARDLVKSATKAASEPKPGLEERATNQGEDYLLRNAFENSPETLGTQ